MAELKKHVTTVSNNESDMIAYRYEVRATVAVAGEVLGAVTVKLGDCRVVIETVDFTPPEVVSKCVEMAFKEWPLSYVHSEGHEYVVREAR